MKAADIDVGESYAFAESTGDYDLIERRVTKVEVLRAATGGRVEVKLLEDGKTRVATPWDEPEPVEGDIRKVKTRLLIMPYHRFEQRLKNLAAHRADKEREDSRKAQRLGRIQERLDRIVPITGPSKKPLRWLGLYEDEVLISTDQLERLLGAAEQD